MRGMMVVAMAATVLVVSNTPAAAQTSTAVAPVTPAKSGMVSYIQGAVYVDGTLIPDPIVATFPYIKEGGDLRTADGRAEVVMNPGIMMRVGENSTVRMITNRFIDTRVELTQGSATVQLVEVPKDNQFTVVDKDATVALTKAGFYHLYADPPSIKVFSGEARVTMNDQTVEVPAGRKLQFSGEKASIERFDKDDTDALDRWSGRRGELVSAANASAARNCGNDTGYAGGYPGGYSTVPIYRFQQGVAVPLGSSYAAATPCLGNWNYNSSYGMWTYIPMLNRYCDPFWGYCYYNPMGAWNYFYQYPPTAYYPGGGSRPVATAPVRTVPATGGLGPSVGLGPASRGVTSTSSSAGIGGGRSSSPAGGGGSSVAAAGSSGGAAGGAVATGHGSTVSAGGGKR